MARTLLAALAGLAILGAGAAAALEVGLASSGSEPPALPPPPALAPLASGAAPTADGFDAAAEGAVTLPLDAAVDALGEATVDADQHAARGVALANAALRNATAAAAKTTRRLVPDAELFNVTNAALTFAGATGAAAASLGAREAALAGAAAARTQAEGRAVAALGQGAAGRLGASAQGFADTAVIAVPVAAEATAAELQRLASGIQVDPAPMLAPLQQAAVDAQDAAALLAEASAARAAFLAADAKSTAQQEAEMNGMAGAEAAAANGAATDGGSAAAAYQQRASGTANDAAGEVAGGLLQQPDPALMLPFDRVEEASLATADLLREASEVLRQRGIEGLDGTAPAGGRARSVSATARNVSAAAAGAADASLVAMRALAAEACVDPLPPMPAGCGAASMVRDAEALLQVAEDIGTLSAGRARARLTGASDAQAAEAIGLLNRGARDLTAAAARMSTQASQNAVAVPTAEAESSGAAALAYGAATADRVLAMPPGLASDLSAEHGLVFDRAVTLGAHAVAAAGDAAFGLGGAAGGVAEAALR